VEAGAWNGLGEAKRTPSPFCAPPSPASNHLSNYLGAFNTLNSAIEHSGTQFPLICRARRENLLTSAFADLGVNLAWINSPSFSSVTAITISQLHRPACRHTPSQTDQEQSPSAYPLFRIEQMRHGLLLQMRIARHTRLPLMQCAIASRILHLVLTQRGVPVSQSHRIPSADFPIVWTPYGL
jgi:hypothetical protein